MRRSSRTAGARTNDRMTASASGHEHDLAEVQRQHDDEADDSQLHGRAGDGGEVIGVLTAADAIYLVLDMDHPRPTPRRRLSIATFQPLFVVRVSA